MITQNTQTYSITELTNHINRVLEDILTEKNQVITQLQRAMHYSVFNGGKRLRPLWVYVTGINFGATLEQLDAPAAAIECIHCYSLVHDDLPAMDNDDLRRGKPTCHKAFDEATAILVGDALQTLAFEILSKANLPAETARKLIGEIAKHAGRHGMVGGQSLDLLAQNRQISLDALQQIHRYKTGALIQTSIRLGAVCANCDDTILANLDIFSKHVGLAFQIQDDILDVESNRNILGKETGGDAKLHKSTYPALLGLNGAKKQLQQEYNKAVAALSQIEQNTDQLHCLTQKMILAS